MPPGTRPTGKTAGGAPGARARSFWLAAAAGVLRHARRAVIMSAAAATPAPPRQRPHASRAFARRNSSSLKRPTSSKLISKMQVSKRSCQAWAPTRSVASRNAVPSLLPCTRGVARGGGWARGGWVGWVGWDARQAKQ